MRWIFPGLVLLWAFCARAERPGDQFVEEVVKQVKQGMQKHQENSVKEIKDPDAHTTPEKLLRRERQPSDGARRSATAEEIIEQTVSLVQDSVRDKFGVVPDDVSDLISPKKLSVILNEANCKATRQIADCSDTCYHSKYRTINGTCNNPDNPLWGASLTSLHRITPTAYENGLNTPRGWTVGRLVNNVTLPSARLVSTAVVSAQDVAGDRRLSHMVMQWGQFVDHDIGLTPLNPINEGFSSGVSCETNCNNELPCFPIPIPDDDLRIKNVDCMGFVRSSAACSSTYKLEPRQQINELTSFIDASNVYGSSYEIFQKLIDVADGAKMLGTNCSADGKCLLPFDEEESFSACAKDRSRDTKCFMAGDIRANEQLGLTSMHTLWIREHNRIAKKLKELNPNWKKSTVFQETRKIIGAAMQHITYKHWLRKIIGSKLKLELGTYRGYDPTLNPSLLNIFTTAAYRFGHALVNPLIKRYDEDGNESSYGHLPLHQAFFAPHRILFEGGIDPVIRGFLFSSMKRVDGKAMLNQELTEFLFALAREIALDLAALNIQRGRDHGLPSYLELREFFGLKTDYDYLKTIIKKPVLLAMEAVYVNLRNVDAWVGMLSEKPVKGALVGELIFEVLIEQFKRLRDGDRFYYENPGVFTKKQLRQIKRVSLSRIICDNADNIGRIQMDAFRLPGKSKVLPCRRIPEMDLTAWEDKDGTAEDCPPAP